MSSTRREQPHLYHTAGLYLLDPGSLWTMTQTTKLKIIQKNLATIMWSSKREEVESQRGGRLEDVRTGG